MEQIRLNIIADLVDKNSIVADIGTDHGLIPIFLSENNIAKKIIATDISNKSLDKLIVKLEEKYWLDNIETRVTDGLNGIRKFEVDTIIISGMGGNLIKEIIAENLDIAKSANNLILQPNISICELRKYLHENGFKIIDEDDAVENGKYYQIIKTETGLEKYHKEYEYEFGKILIEKKSKNLLIYLDKIIKSKKRLITELKEIEGENIDNRINELNNILDYLEELRNLIED